MLAELNIRNLGLIEQVTIPFSAGLNVLTGETGAGKSIIVEALDLALGGRASADAIRTGEEKASVSSFFSGLGAVAKRCLNAGIDMEDDLLMQRELSRNGRNICRINGQMVPLALYREAGRLLVDMHGQHEQHHLAVADKRLDLCDRFGGPALGEVVAVLRQVFAGWQEAAAALQRLADEERDAQSRMAQMEQFLVDVDRLNPQIGEEKELEKERVFLGSREKIAALLFDSCQVLYGDGLQNPSVTDLVGRVVNDLDALAGLDPRVAPLKESMVEALCLIEEAALELASLRDHQEFDAGRLTIIEERLDLYTRLYRRYDYDGDALVERAESARRELAALRDTLTNREQAARREDKLRLEFEAAAAKASVLRREAALSLEKEVTVRLRSLEMERMVFKVDFTEAPPSPRGIDMVDFLISPNAGEPLRPLNRIASGGELSRIMLALKAVLAEADETPCLVFDEVDAGIGGRALTAVADSLAGVARVRQVIVVTHAAQVASRADSHFHVHKEEFAGRTRTRAVVLDEEARVGELTRMLGGRDAGAAARDHALELRKAGKTG